MTEIQNPKQKNNRSRDASACAARWTGLEFEIRDLFEIWCLEFEICLKFGAWNFGFQKVRERLPIYNTGVPALLRRDTLYNDLRFVVSVHGFKGSGFRGSGFKDCILIIMHYFVNLLYGKTDRFYIPTNPEHGIWQLLGKMNICNEDFGFSMPFRP